MSADPDSLELDAQVLIPASAIRRMIDQAIGRWTADNLEQVIEAAIDRWAVANHKDLIDEGIDRWASRRSQALRLAPDSWPEEAVAFGRAVMAARVSLRLERYDFAKLAGIAPKTLFNIEKAKHATRANIRQAIIKALTDFSEFPPSWQPPPEDNDRN